jgi:hypothetical protein
LNNFSIAILILSKQCNKIVRKLIVFPRTSIRIYRKKFEVLKLKINYSVCNEDSESERKALRLSMFTNLGVIE